MSRDHYREAAPEEFEHVGELPYVASPYAVMGDQTEVYDSPGWGRLLVLLGVGCGMLFLLVCGVVQVVGWSR